MWTAPAWAMWGPWSSTTGSSWLVKGPHPAKKPDASKDVPEDADFCEYHADEPDNAALLSSPVVNENEVTDDDFDHEHDE